MKAIHLLILSILACMTMKLHSQEVPLTLDDLIPGGKSFASLYKYRSLQPDRLRWFGDRLTYVKGDSIMTVSSSEKGGDDLFMTKQEINSKVVGGSISHLRSVAEMYGKENNLLINTSEGDTYLLNILTNKTEGKYRIESLAENADFSVASKTYAYTKKNNLYVQISTGEEFSVTEDEDVNIVNGVAVHQNEFGINKGTFWSPSGKSLAFYRMDESMVADYPLVDASSRIAKLKSRKYPMAGMKSHHVTLGVFDFTSKRTVFLKTGTPKEKFLTNVAWSPDEKYIYMAELNRGQDTCLLKRYNAQTGHMDALLFEESHPKYVEPQNPVLFLKNDADRFLWQSKRDGYNHVYLYSTSGKMLKQITKGSWDVTSVLGFDEKGDNLIVISTESSPIERHVVKVNLKTGKRTRLSKESGVHNAILSQSGKYLYDAYTAQNNPGEIALTYLDKNTTFVFHKSKNPYRNVTLPQIELGTIQANDGKTDLYYRLIKPLNFDVNKKYPVVIYVYGGPHSQLVDNSWMGQARGWDIYMAEKGYVVFTLDNRGTLNRGFDFENVTHRQLGVIETEDQMAGVTFLKQQSYVDHARIGVHGWSYGGFMTLSMMLRHPDVFKVGVAGGPVTDWKYYEIMYGERYMDSPQENPEGYKESGMVDKAGSLQGRLLLIHGDEDPVVVMQHSLQFLKSAVRNKVHPDFFIYTGHEHNVMGVDRVHLHEHITRYFEDFLK